MIPIRTSVLNEALKIAPILGFTEETLLQTCQRMNYSPGSLALFFPQGPVHIVDHLTREANKTSLRLLRESSVSGSIGNSCDILKMGLLERFQCLFPYSKHWGHGMMLMTKHFKLKALLEFRLFLDELIHHAEKAPKGLFSRSVQRCTLGGICLAAELHLINDRSPGNIETQMLLTNLVMRM